MESFITQDAHLDHGNFKLIIGPEGNQIHVVEFVAKREKENKY